MTKKQLTGKLTLKKSTIVNLNATEMNDSRAGIIRTQIGISCETGQCCVTTPVQCNPENMRYSNRVCTFLCSDFLCIF